MAENAQKIIKEIRQQPLYSLKNCYHQHGKDKNPLNLPLPFPRKSLPDRRTGQRKLTRNRRIFPNDEAALKAMYLAISQASRNWKQIHHWKPALQTFQVMFGEDRVPLAALQ